MLLKAGADKDFVDGRGWKPYGRTPLQSAAEDGMAEVVKLLLAAGARKEARNTADKTSLQVAREKRHTAVVALLT